MGIWSHSLPSGLFLTACCTAVGLCPGQSCEVRLLKPFFPTVNTPKQLLNRKARFIRTDAKIGDFLGRKLKIREIKTKQYITISPPCLLCPGKTIFAKACSQSNDLQRNLHSLLWASREGSFEAWAPAVLSRHLVSAIHRTYSLATIIPQ